MTVLIIPNKLSSRRTAAIAVNRTSLQYIYIYICMKIIFLIILKTQYHIKIITAYFEYVMCTK